jgi:thiol-disulfide isomerase/thioredoxin
VKISVVLLTIGLIGSIGLSITATSAAEDLYKRAVLNYQAHHYSSALADLERLEAAYPTNAMVRYYRALCYQGTNQITLAKKDFEWVAANCPDAKVKQLGAIGLRNLGSYRAQVTGFVSAPTTQMAARPASGLPTPSTSSGIPSPSSSTNAANKLRKVLQFTSATCPICITFAPIFEQTKGKYSGIDMQTLDVADAGNSALVEQYSVKNYPTIVFLSNNGSVLFKRAGAPDTVAQFSQLIDRYR